MTIKDAARFAVSVPRPAGVDPSGEAFDNIVWIIRAALRDEIERMVRAGELVRL